MTASTTTFNERLIRIESGTAVQAASLLSIAKANVIKKARRLVKPLIICLTLLAGGAVYEWMDIKIDVNSIIALVS